MRGDHSQKVSIYQRATCHFGFYNSEFLCLADLIQVYLVASRVNVGYRGHLLASGGSDIFNSGLNGGSTSNGEAMNSENGARIWEEIENYWNALKALFAKAGVSLEWEFDKDGDENGSISGNSRPPGICPVCLCPTVAGPVKTFAGNDYHVRCANLWFNYIDGMLPQIR